MFVEDVLWISSENVFFSTSIFFEESKAGVLCDNSWIFVEDGLWLLKDFLIEKSWNPNDNRFDVTEWNDVEKKKRKSKMI